MIECSETHDSLLICDEHIASGNVHSARHPEGGRVYWREPDDLLAISANVDECEIRRWPGNHEEHVAVNVYPGLDGASDMCIERGLSHVFVVEQARDEHVVVRNVYQDAGPMMRMLHALTEYSFDGFIEWCAKEYREGRLDLNASRHIMVHQAFELGDKVRILDEVAKCWNVPALCEISERPSQDRPIAWGVVWRRPSTIGELKFERLVPAHYLRLVEKRSET